MPLLISARSQYEEPPLQQIHYKLDDDDDDDDDDNDNDNNNNNNNDNNDDGKSGNAFKRASNWYRTFSVNAAT